MLNPIQMRRLLQGAAAAMLCSSAACTVMPGLNISEKDVPSGNQYRIEKSPDENGYKVVSAGPGVDLEVDEITPTVIQRERALIESNSGQPSLEVVNPGMVPAEYRVGPGDSLSITVFEHPELTNPIGITQDPSSLGHLVDSGGHFFYPYVGEVDAQGKTVAELRSLIADRLSPVIQRPQVDVRVVAFRAKRIQVSGEVVEPGTVTLDDTPKGVIEAIAFCKGLNSNASRRRAFLYRGGQSYSIDLAGILSGRHPDLNPALQPGDTLQVPDRSNDQVFVLGEVAKQSPIIIQQDGMTLTEALTTAGGLQPLSAADSGVLVFRRPFAPGQAPRIFKLDISNPVGLLLAGEFELQPTDVIYVKKTDFAAYGSVVAQLLPTISALYQLTSIQYYLKHP